MSDAGCPTVEDYLVEDGLGPTTSQGKTEDRCGAANSKLDGDKMATDWTTRAYGAAYS